jgi:hypothetical protein
MPGEIEKAHKTTSLKIAGLQTKDLSPELPKYRAGELTD